MTREARSTSDVALPQAGGSSVEGNSKQLVVTALSLDERCVLVLPWTVASTEIETLAVLSSAQTFGEVQLRPPAAALVEEWLPAFVELQEEQEVDPVVRGHHDDAFDAQDFFGADNQFVWRPDPASTTAAWLEDIEPELADKYLQGDRGGLLDQDSCPFVAPQRREAVEHDLAAHGYEVRQWPTLAELYLDPGPDARAMLRGVASQRGRPGAE